ncbi:MAG: hypothetical protein ACTS5A_02135 [Candidatus Hodgkinia cicadicola]
MKQLSSFTIFTSGYAKVVSMTFPILPLISANGLRTFNSEVRNSLPRCWITSSVLYISSAQTYKTLRKSQPCARNKI